MIAHPNGHRPKSAARRSASLITVETRLKEIEELLVRVTGYSEFMCSGAGLEGTSKEARDQAIIDFHERMVSMERHLARVHDEFRLG